MNQFRPEYAEAVSWAVLNHWFFASLLIPPLLLWTTTWFRCHWVIITGALVASLLLCWLTFGLGVHYIWDVKELHAQTEAEWADVTADTAKLFAPAFIGIPYAFVYNAVNLAIGLGVGAIGDLWIPQRTGNMTEQTTTAV